MKAMTACLVWAMTTGLVSVAARAADGDYAIHGPPAQGTTLEVTPRSSIEQPGDVGKRAHTNYRIGVPAQRIDGPGTTVPPR